MKLLQIGAGRIGRSLSGQLFSAAGYEVVFVDMDRMLIDALNSRHGYTVVVKDTPSAQIAVTNVRGIHAQDSQAVVREVAEADIICVSVGKENVVRILPVLAEGLMARTAAGLPGVDIILAENLRDAAARVRDGLRERLPEGFPISEYVGLVETSIGKMCPIMPDEVLQADPAEVWCEAYNTLVCDRRGFLHGVPPVPGLDPKDNMVAYVDCKSFIHNLGHAVCAYAAYQIEPVFEYVYQALHHPDVRAIMMDAMHESARALIAEYPSEFDVPILEAHIADLIRRFGNEALADSIHRIGRDLPRKLARDDRLIGAALFAARHGIDTPNIITGIACGFLFRKPDANGDIYEPDRQFAEQLAAEGPDAILSTICGLGISDPGEIVLRTKILAEYDHWSTRAPYDGGHILAHRP